MTEDNTTEVPSVIIREDNAPFSMISYKNQVICYFVFIFFSVFVCGLYAAFKYYKWRCWPEEKRKKRIKAITEKSRNELRAVFLKAQKIGAIGTNQKKPPKPKPSKRKSSKKEKHIAPVIIIDEKSIPITDASPSYGATPTSQYTPGPVPGGVTWELETSSRSNGNNYGKSKKRSFETKRPSEIELRQSQRSIDEENTETELVARPIIIRETTIQVETDDSTDISTSESDTFGQSGVVYVQPGPSKLPRSSQSDRAKVI